MKKKMEKKTVHLSLRITEDEAIKMKHLMNMMGYRSMSLFIRDQLFRSRVQRRNLRKTEANLTRQIEQVRMEIKRIGVNYNQVVRSMNTLSKLRDRHGNSVVSAAAIDGNLTDMKKMMEALLQKVALIENEVEQVKSGEPEHF